MSPNPGGAGSPAPCAACSGTTRTPGPSTTPSPRTTTGSRIPGRGWSSGGRPSSSTTPTPPGTPDATSTAAVRRPPRWAIRRSGGWARSASRWSSSGWALARDWRAGAILSGLVGGYLPWFLYQYRTIFEFYAIAFVPWVVLAVVYCLGLVLGPPGASESRRRRGGAVFGAYVLTAVLTCWFFFPIDTGRNISQTGVDLRDWFPSWF